MLGWDITDFGSGTFEETGLLLFTLRNGNLSKEQYTKTYAERCSSSKQDKSHHFTSTGIRWRYYQSRWRHLLIELYNPQRMKSWQIRCTVSMDGRNYLAPAGTVVSLAPGQSITLFPGTYHRFWGEKGKGTVLVGEVSQVNDDNTDNRFLEPLGRFPEIEENEPPLHLLVTDYGKYYCDG